MRSPPARADEARRGAVGSRSTTRGRSTRLVWWTALGALVRGGLGSDVIAAQKISNLEGGLAAFYTLDSDDRFGHSAVALGDVNGDGITDLAVGAPRDNDGADGAGAVYVLFMNVTVISAQKISNLHGGLSAFYTLDAYDGFGWFDYEGISATPCFEGHCCGEALEIGSMPSMCGGMREVELDDGTGGVREIELDSEPHTKSKKTVEL